MGKWADEWDCVRGGVGAGVVVAVVRGERGLVGNEMLDGAMEGGGVLEGGCGWGRVSMVW